MAILTLYFDNTPVVDGDTVVRSVDGNIVTTLLTSGGDEVSGDVVLYTKESGGDEVVLSNTGNYSGVIPDRVELIARSQTYGNSVTVNAVGTSEISASNRWGKGKLKVRFSIDFS